MKQAKYRVEAFIIPVCIDSNTNSVPSETHDERLQLNDISNAIVSVENTEAICVENSINNSLAIEEESIQNARNSITLKRLAKKNKSTSTNFDYASQNLKTKYEASYNMNFTSKIFNKVERLTPINEQNEDVEEKITDLCYHGCRNGCSAVVPTPQEVSEEIFKENWLQKLDNIKQKEAELKNREVILQNRERALTRKEKEIRILECQLNDKLKQLDVDLKKNKLLHDLLRISSINKNSQDSIKDIDSKASQEEIHRNDVKTDRTCVDDLNFCIENSQAQDSNKQLSNNIGNICKDSQEKRSSGSSSSSSDHSMSYGKRYKQRPACRNSTTLKSSGSKSVSSNFIKTKRPAKIHYEDLDTTLSADIGDSSFVHTSQKFNPELYRKPYAFTRSASERRGKYQSKGSSMNLQVKNLGSIWEEFEKPVGMEQDKVLQRVTKNISVSQDKSTKFQNYGLIDYNVSTTNAEHKMENENKYSYLNLETGNKVCLHQRFMKNSKDRPVSWNEETNEWLQKKRKAYMTTTKILTKDTEDKENHKCNIKNDKTDKVFKKSDIKNKILTIFR